MTAAIFGVAIALQLTGTLGDLLDSFPTTYLASWLVNGWRALWVLGIGLELFLIVAMVALGAVPAHVRRSPRTA